MEGMFCMLVFKIFFLCFIFFVEWIFLKEFVIFFFVILGGGVLGIVCFLDIVCEDVYELYFIWVFVDLFDFLFGIKFFRIFGGEDLIVIFVFVFVDFEFVSKFFRLIWGVDVIFILFGLDEICLNLLVVFGCFLIFFEGVLVLIEISLFWYGVVVKGLKDEIFIRFFLWDIVW